MRTRNDAIIAGRQFIQLIRDQGVRVSAAILFGSFAKGTANEQSDIDIAVVSPDFSGFRFNDLGIIAKSKLKADKDIEVLPFSESGFTGDDPFVSEIISTGLRLV